MADMPPVIAETLACSGEITRAVMNPLEKAPASKIMAMMAPKMIYRAFIVAPVSRDYSKSAGGNTPSP